MDNFGSRLKHLRIERKLKADELAKKSGMSRASIFRLEKSGSNASFDTIKRLASALGVDVMELIGDTEGKSFEQVVAENPEMAKDLIPTADQAEMFQRLMLAISTSPKEVAAAIVALPHAGERYREWQAKPEQKDEDDGRESLRQWLQPAEALALLKWVRGHMKDLPAETDLSSQLQRLSLELGRLSGLEDRQVRQAALQKGVDSVSAKKPVGASASTPIGKSR